MYCCLYCGREFIDSALYHLSAVTQRDAMCFIQGFLSSEVGVLLSCNLSLEPIVLCLPSPNYMPTFLDLYLDCLLASKTSPSTPSFIPSLPFPELSELIERAL